jgi:hypothetical protein
MKAKKAYHSSSYYYVIRVIIISSSVVGVPDGCDKNAKLAFCNSGFCRIFILYGALQNASKSAHFKSASRTDFGKCAFLKCTLFFLVVHFKVRAVAERALKIITVFFLF